MACQETQADPHRCHVSPSLHHRADHAHEDPPAHLAHQDKWESLAQSDLKELQEWTELKESLDQRDPMEHQETWDPQDPGVQQERTHPTSHWNKESLESPERWDLPDLLVQLDSPVWTVCKDLRALLARREPMDQTESMASPVPRDLRAGLANQEREESAPSTAPSTEESSSRTELAAKQQQQQQQAMLSAITMLAISLSITLPYLANLDLRYVRAASLDHSCIL